MKPSLERTAILPKDLAEQPQTDYVVILGTSNIALAADETSVYDDTVTVLYKRRVIARFPAAADWLQLRRDYIEPLTRAEQLKRVVNNKVAELDFAKELAPEVPASAEDAPVGQYI